MFLTAVLIVGIVMAGVGKASPEAVIKLEPKDNTAERGETFSVDITVTGIVTSETPPVSNGLFGWEAWMTFNPKVLHVVNTTEGPFLKSAGYSTSWYSSANNTEGTVMVGATIEFWNPPYPENGSVGNGVLATLVFEVVSEGTSSLHFEAPKEVAKTSLYTLIANNLVREPVAVEDGAFDNQGFVFATELIIAVVVVAVVVCAAAVFFYRRRKASALT